MPQAALPGRQLGVLSQVGIQVLEGVATKAGWALQHVKRLEGTMEAIISRSLRQRSALDW